MNVLNRKFSTHLSPAEFSEYSRGKDNSPFYKLVVENRRRKFSALSGWSSAVCLGWSEIIEVWRGRWFVCLRTRARGMKKNFRRHRALVVDYFGSFRGILGRALVFHVSLFVSLRALTSKGNINGKKVKYARLSSLSLSFPSLDSTNNTAQIARSFEWSLIIWRTLESETKHPVRPVIRIFVGPS